MNAETHSPGLFGTLSTHAGFARRRLPSRFVSAWDNWLQASLRTSQRMLGDEWLDLYLSGNIWRFVLQADVCNENAWAGVIMPSADSGNHYFPLTLAAPIPAPLARRKLFKRAAEWFDHLERLAIFSLSDDAELDHLDNLLAGLPPVESGADSFLGRLFRKSPAGETLWQTTGDDHKALIEKTFRGLPRPEEFIGLLTEHIPPHQPVPDPKPSAPAPPRSNSQTICVEKSGPATAMGCGLQWRSWALTDVGKRRKINEDAYLNQPETGLWVVADGMGGHSAGDVASRKVVEKLGQAPPANALATLEETTRLALQKVNADLLDMAAEMGPGHVVGATVVAMLAAGDTCVALWAGDSRLYRLRNGELDQLTQDHSMAAELARSDQPVPEGYGDNIVTRALGADPSLELDRIEFHARPEDLYLICSDGLTKEVLPEEIEKILDAEGGQKAVRTLMNLALDRQASDNVTLLVVHAAPSAR